MPRFRKTSIEQYTMRGRFCQVALLLVLVGLLVVALAVVVWLDNGRRGVALGPELPHIAQADVPPLGVNLFLDREPDEATIRRTLQLARDMGAHWVKQLFPWDQIEPDAKGDFWDERYNRSTWEHYDRIVALCQEYGLELIVRLDRPPDWARQQALSTEALQAAKAENPDRDISGPPDNLADYGDFVYAVLARYRGQVHYVQLWNEPNLANEWNWAPINPGKFVELLRIGYTRAKEADPDATVLFPSLAPNDGRDPRYMSDLAFLDAVYRAGGKAYFDVMSAQLYGLGQPPTEHSPLGIDREHLRLITRTDVSRVVLLREIMERYGDQNKAVWVGELGWNSTPPDWQGEPSPWGPNVSEETKGRYLIEALDRSMREWPWMGVRNIWFLRWGGPPPKVKDPTPFFGLVSYDFALQPSYTALQGWTAAAPLGVGYHELGRPGRLESSFLGTRLDLLLDPANPDVRVEVDGQAQTCRFWREEEGLTRCIAASGLADAQHTLSIAGPVNGIYVVRQLPFTWLLPALTGVLSLALLAAMVLLVLRLPGALIEMAAWILRQLERFRGLPERRQGLIVLGGLALGLAVVYRSPSLPFALLALLLVGLLALLRLDLGLLAAIFVIPLYTQPAHLAGAQFSLLEIMLLICLAAAAAELALRWLARLGRKQEGEPIMQGFRFRWAEFLPALVFLFICAGSLLWSTDRTFITDQGVPLLRISLREFRVTIVEPFLLYPLLLWAFHGRRERAWWPVDALVLSAVLVSLGGIVQVLDPSLRTEVADGVRRATSVYGTFSANALALFLGRVLALAVAGAFFLPKGRRRWLYLAALPLLGGAFFLTYSRAGYIALALILLLYGLLASRVLFLVEAGAGALGALAVWLIGAWDRIFNIQTFGNRITMWQNTWPLLRKHLWTGMGLDAFYHYYHRRYPQLVEAYWTPHNVVLEFWTRLGLIGLAAGAWLYTAFFVRAAQAYRRLSDQSQRMLALGLLGSVAYGLLHGLLDGTFFAPDWAAMFWVGYGLVALIGQ